MRSGPMTAGKLGEITGLTSGAITGIIDRLTDAGWVKRIQDPADRRRVIVTPTSNPKKAQEVQEVFGTLSAAMGELMKSYTDAELTLMLDFMARSRKILLEQAAEVRTKKKSRPSKKS